MKNTMKNINILTLLFSITILVGLWTIQNGDGTLLQIKNTNAQEEEVINTSLNGESSSYETPSSTDYPSEIASEVPSEVASEAPSDQCTTPSLVCCNPYGNHIGRPLGECEECNYTPGACDSSSDTSSASDYPSYTPSDVPSYVPSDYPSYTPSDVSSACPSADCYTPVCCTPGNKNYVQGPGEGEVCDPEVCEACDEYMCCNQNATNYVEVGNRPSGEDNCAPPHTTCRTDEPTCEFEPCDPTQNPGCDGGCAASVSCISSNGIVSITGMGAASFPGDSGCSAETAVDEANAACSSLTPDMPVGSTVIYSAFAVAMVTGRDVCLNLPGDQEYIPLGYSRAADGSCVSDKDTCQNSGGVWIDAQQICINPVPACGFSSGKTDLQNPPTTGLCDPGAATAVTTNTDSYVWTCKDVTVGLYGVDCSAGRCTGPNCGTTDLCSNIPGDQDNQYILDNNLTRTSDGECYPNNIDLCSNIAGMQDAQYIDANNLYRDEYGRCWDDNGGACGTAMNMLTWATQPQNNLCDPNSTPTPVTVDDANLKYNWTCLDVDGHTVGSCSVNMLCPSNQKNCKGQCIPITDTCIETATTTLIQTFKVAPRFVQKATDSCTLSWSVSNDNPDPDMPLKCSINGVNVTSFNSSKSVSPGVQRMYCTLGSEYQEKAVRCEINPEYKEI